MIKINMPALSPSMESGTIVKWLKKEGEKISVGDILAEIETDKAIMDMESVQEGVLGEILVKEGLEAQINTPIAILLEAGENMSDLSISSTEGSKKVISNSDTNEEKLSVINQQNTTKSEEKITESHSKNITVREAINMALVEEMHRDEDVFVIGEEVAQYNGAFKVTQGMLDIFGPRRVIDTPISEYGFTNIAIGSAFAGLKPVIEFMSFNFSMQALDAILNSAAKTHYMSGGMVQSSVVFRGPNGYGPGVAAQHGQEYSSFYAHCPGLKVIAPYSGADFKGLLKSAIRDPNPVIFLESEVLYTEHFDVPKDKDFLVPIGKANILKEGNDITIISFSTVMKKVLDAAQELQKKGISVEVIDLRTLRPLDEQTLFSSVKKTNRAIIVEEGWKFAGIGSEISAILMEHCFDWLDAPVGRINSADTPLPYAPNLEVAYLPTVEEIVKLASKLVIK